MFKFYGFLFTLLVSGEKNSPTENNFISYWTMFFLSCRIAGNEKGLTSGTKSNQY